MADGVAITAGSGTTIAADDCGAAGYAQFVKLAISTDGSATAIPADGTNGLAVDVKQMAALPAGTNNIGDVDIASIAAGTNLIGKMACGGNDEYYSGATALTVKWATVAASTSGDNTIVAAVSGKKIRVLQAELIANGTVNVKWQSGASGTDKTGLAYMVVNSGYVLPYSPIGWFETAASTLLNLNLSAAIAVGGVIAYVEV